jgi:hypothetical protein
MIFENYLIFDRTVSNVYVRRTIIFVSYIDFLNFVLDSICFIIYFYVQSYMFPIYFCFII